MANWKDDLRAELGIRKLDTSELEQMPAEEYARRLRETKSVIVTIRCA